METPSRPKLEVSIEKGYKTRLTFEGASNRASRPAPRQGAGAEWRRVAKRNGMHECTSCRQRFANRGGDSQLRGTGGARLPGGSGSRGEGKRKEGLASDFCPSTSVEPFQVLSGRYDEKVDAQGSGDHCHFNLTETLCCLCCRKSLVGPLSSIYTTCHLMWTYVDLMLRLGVLASSPSSYSLASTPSPGRRLNRLLVRI